MEDKFTLILTIVNVGFTEAVAEAAKDVGGGIVIHARRGASEADKSFLGISLDTEKEIVAIMAPLVQKTEIMRRISQSCGITSKARGIIFSLPLDDAINLA